MIVRGLVDRDSAARLVLTSDGCAVLNALLGDQAALGIGRPENSRPR